MGMSGLLSSLLYKRNGEARRILRVRMQMAKYAATRGWIVPFLTVRGGVSQKWRRAKKDDPIGYKSYIELDVLSLRILEEIERRSNRNSNVLDLGCNVGRELNALWKKGFHRLTGVEIGEEPVKAMRELFPDMAAGSTIVNESMGSALPKFAADKFDLVYAHGSLVSIGANEQYVYDEMVRVCRKCLITLENEWSLLLFPRDFGRVFTDRGMTQVSEETILTDSSRNKQAVLRVFEKTSRA